MPEFKYAIVGGGMTGHAAAQAIRSVDASGSIAMIGDEPERPYARPPLSKGLWTGQEEGSIWLPELEDVALRTGARVVELDRAGRRLVLDGRDVIRYERLLLATGGAPRRLPFGGEEVVYYRTVADYRRLESLPIGRHVTVVGGGFIGSEMAASLATAGYQVTMLFPEEGIGARILPRDLALWLNDYYAEREVEVKAGVTLDGIERDGQRFALQTSAGALRTDLVLAGVGIVPNDRLAAAAGLTVDDGIVVDEMLRTSDPAIYAAGDVARFPSPHLGRHIRVEHEDNANRMGRAAGLAMAGAGEPYRHLPFFYSDLFDLGYEAVGVLDSRLETVADWKQQFQRGFVYYLAERRVVGVLAWGAFGKMDAARELIAQPGPHDAAALIGRIA